MCVCVLRGHNIQFADSGRFNANLKTFIRVRFGWYLLLLRFECFVFLWARRFCLLRFNFAPSLFSTIFANWNFSRWSSVFACACVHIFYFALRCLHNLIFFLHVQQHTVWSTAHTCIRNTSEFPNMLIYNWIVCANCSRANGHIIHTSARHMLLDCKLINLCGVCRLYRSRYLFHFLWLAT